MTLLTWAGLGLTLSGLFHITVWLAAGLPSLEGPVTWRKPIVFGLSTGVLTLSLAWVVSLLPQTRRLTRQALVFVVLLLTEVALIDLQQWRGVGSHFNSATPFDGAVFTAMGTIIMAATVIMLFWTIAVFRPLRAPAHVTLSARAGMLLLNAGNVVGIFIAVYGAAQVDAGLAPNVLGAAGQLKVPHAVALHGIQVLPLIAWFASRSTIALGATRRASAGYGGLLLVALLQTFSGRAPLDLTIASALLLVTSIALMGWSVARALSQTPGHCVMLPEWDVQQPANAPASPRAHVA